MTDCEKATDKSLEIKLATSLDEMHAAFRLLYDRYMNVGLQESEPEAMRISFHHLLPVTTTIIACRDGNIVGTLSVVNDSRAGIPMGDLFQKEVNAIRKSGSSICELSGLAVEAQQLSESREILLALFKKAFILAYDLLECTDFCMMVNPHHAAYYTKKLQFKQIGRVRSYNKVNNAPALPLRLNSAATKELFQLHIPSLYQYFFIDERLEIIERTRRELGKQRSLLQKKYIEFLLDCNQNLLDSLTTAEQGIFYSYYPMLEFGSTGLSSMLKQGEEKQDDTYWYKSEN